LPDDDTSSWRSDAKVLPYETSKYDPEPNIRNDIPDGNPSKLPKDASNAIDNLPSDEFLDRELGNAWAILPDGRIGLAFTRESLNQATDWKQKAEEIKKFTEELGEVGGTFTIRDYPADLEDSRLSFLVDYGLQPFKYI
jgi:hypothetical protein